MLDTRFSILDQDFGTLTEYFEELLGRDFIRRVLNTGSKTLKPHFWYHYIKAYKQWRRRGGRINDVTHDKKLIRFAMLVNYVKQFEQDWSVAKRKDEFLHRLKNTNQVVGLLFELRTGIHFLRAGLSVHWIGGSSDRRQPDLEIVNLPEHEVLLECTHRTESLGRTLWDKKLTTDLLAAANEKLESKIDWENPRIVIVKIPELINWAYEHIRLDIDRMVSNWFKNERLASVNALIFMGGDTIIPMYNRAGRIYGYDTDQEVYIVRNPCSRYPLPQNVDERLAHPKKIRK